jgi:hypothetical protein
MNTPRMSKRTAAALGATALGALVIIGVAATLYSSPALQLASSRR